MLAPFRSSVALCRGRERCDNSETASSVPVAVGWHTVPGPGGF